MLAAGHCRRPALNADRAGAKMNQRIKNIIIVGGGAAGWISAGRIAAMHAQDPACGISVTLVESPTAGIIGVGEGTWPTMRSTLMKMGISETDFMREGDATFKPGAKFARQVDGKAFGGKLNMVPVVLSEFLKLVVQYPIAFAKDKDTGRHPAAEQLRPVLRRRGGGHRPPRQRQRRARAGALERAAIRRAVAVRASRLSMAAPVVVQLQRTDNKLPVHIDMAYHVRAMAILTMLRN